VLESQRRELQYLSDYNRKRSAVLSGRVQARNLFEPGMTNRATGKWPATRATPAAGGGAPRTTPPEQQNSQAPNGGVQRVENHNVVRRDNAEGQKGEQADPGEEIYATPVQNLMAAAALFEDVPIEGNTPEQMSLRRGVTLIRATRLQQEPHSFALAERLASQSQPRPRNANEAMPPPRGSPNREVVVQSRPPTGNRSQPEGRRNDNPSAGRPSDHNRGRPNEGSNHAQRDDSRNERHDGGSRQDQSTNRRSDRHDRSCEPSDLHHEIERSRASRSWGSTDLRDHLNSQRHIGPSCFGPVVRAEKFSDNFKLPREVARYDDKVNPAL
jgi:hypothetical protein